MSFYGVRVGRRVGVFTTWSECEAVVKGFAGARYKKFSTYSEAEEFSKGQTVNGSPPKKARKRPSYVLEEDRVIVYTDGACIGPQENRQAGYGVYWGPGNPMNVSERLKGEQTNNRAEIEAAITAAIQAKTSGIKMLGIATDSKFAKKCATEWGPIWEKNGWKLTTGKPVKLREPVERLLKATRDSTVDVAWYYVPGHQGIEGNEAADRLANEGARKPLT